MQIRTTTAIVNIKYRTHGKTGTKHPETIALLDNTITTLSEKGYALIRKDEATATLSKTIDPAKESGGTLMHEIMYSLPHDHRPDGIEIIVCRENNTASWFPYLHGAIQKDYPHIHSAEIIEKELQKIVGTPDGVFPYNILDIIERRLISEHA